MSQKRANQRVSLLSFSLVSCKATVDLDRESRNSHVRRRAGLGSTLHDLGLSAVVAGYREDKTSKGWELCSVEMSKDRGTAKSEDEIERGAEACAGKMQWHRGVLLEG